MDNITIIEITPFDELIVEVPGVVEIGDGGIFDLTFDPTFE